MFTFSFKFSQTSLITKELIRHESKFNRKVFHDRENSENRFSEFSYFMKRFKKYIMNISRWNALKEIFHSVCLPLHIILIFCVIVRRNCPSKHFPVQSRIRNAKKEWIVFRVNNKDIRTTSTLNISLVYLE